MKALDDAVARELEGIAPHGVAVYYGSAGRDDPPPYYVHRSLASQRGRVAGSSVDARTYTHAIVAVSDDPDEAEALREAAYAHFQRRTLAIEGWQPTTPCDWLGEVHDPGELLPGGGVVYFAGDQYVIDIYRPRQ